MNVLWKVIPDMANPEGPGSAADFDKVCALMQRLGGGGELLERTGEVNPALYLERLKNVFGSESKVVGDSADKAPNARATQAIAELKNKL